MISLTTKVCRVPAVVTSQNEARATCAASASSSSPRSRARLSSANHLQRRCARRNSCQLTLRRCCHIKLARHANLGVPAHAQDLPPSRLAVVFIRSRRAESRAALQTNKPTFEREPSNPASPSAARVTDSIRGPCACARAPRGSDVRRGAALGAGRRLIGDLISPPDARWRLTSAAASLILPQ